MKLLLIDSDFILWKCVPNKVLSESEIMWGMSSEKTLEETFKLIDDYIINKIFIPTQADYYIGYLGGVGNFRTSISPEYKADRIGKEFPKYFFEAKQYLVDKWKFVKVDGIEAEDAIGITLSKEIFGTSNNVFHRSDFEFIVVGQDHDLDQLSGIHYNPVKNEWKTISEMEASFNFNLQLLIGCKTDLVSGLKKGIGEVKAKKILNELTKGDDRVRVVIAYVKEYGLKEGIKRFKKAYSLLTILRGKEDFVIPDLQEVNCIPKQQTDFNNVEF